MIFHLAIPAKNLEASTNFYRNLGAKIGRQYKDSVIMDLFGAQVVLHKSLKTDQYATMYPRHFGLIVEKLEILQGMWERWKDSDHVFAPLFVRHQGDNEEHQTFFLKDPANNSIEFKWYKDHKYALK